jgi:hypothetical protein
MQHQGLKPRKKKTTQKEVKRNMRKVHKNSRQHPTGVERTGHKGALRSVYAPKRNSGGGGAPRRTHGLHPSFVDVQYLLPSQLSASQSNLIRYHLQLKLGLDGTLGPLAASGKLGFCRVRGLICEVWGFQHQHERPSGVCAAGMAGRQRRYMLTTLDSQSIE